MKNESGRRSQKSMPIEEKNQRRFLRNVICEAQQELGRLESSFKIMETTLLTAMGSLGISRGFNGRHTAENNHVNMVSRGMDNGTVAFLKDNFQNVMRHYFFSRDTTSSTVDVEIRMIPTNLRDGDPLSASNLCIVVGWRLGKTLNGMMGLGVKIKECSFSDIEIDFIYNLSDHMMMALQGIDAKSVIHTLENELVQARQRAVDTTACSDAALQDLEETRFRLSGFNDIFHELSDLKESQQVVDTFLLVLLGNFSARSGSILYMEESTGRVYKAVRGSSRLTMDNHDPGTEVARKILAELFESRQVPKIGAMQAAVMHGEQLSLLHPQVSDSHIAILFKIDDASKGILCLGKRLVTNQYGPREQELLLAFTHNFLVFFNNCRSFETIQQLHAEQEDQNIALKKTIEELTSCKIAVDGMEKAGERIKAAISKTMARTRRVSIMDISIILIAGMLLGLVYNFASPSGIAIIPQVWLRPPSPQIDAMNARAMITDRKAIFVDARPVEFYNQQHIEGSLNLPPALFDFVYMMRLSRLDADKPIIVYGRTISRHYDQTIAHQLTDRGHRKVYVLNGGLKAWQH